MKTIGHLTILADQIAGRRATTFRSLEFMAQDGVAAFGHWQTETGSARDDAHSLFIDFTLVVLWWMTLWGNYLWTRDLLSGRILCSIATTQRRVATARQPLTLLGSRLLKRDDGRLRRRAKT